MTEIIEICIKSNSSKINIYELIEYLIDFLQLQSKVNLKCGIFYLLITQNTLGFSQITLKMYKFM